jgi:hypothetical protein
MHQLTGDFYTTGEVLGHTLAGIGASLGLSMNFEALTARYVDVRLERKRKCLTSTTPPSTRRAGRRKRKRRSKNRKRQKGVKRSCKSRKCLQFLTASYITLRSSGTILAPRADFRRVGERKKEKSKPAQT